MAQAQAIEYKSGEELKILEEISQFDLTQWKQARNKTIEMFENGERELRQISKHAGIAKVASGHSRLFSGAATIVGFATFNPVLLYGGLAGLAASGVGSSSATAYKENWSGTKKKELEKLHKKDIEYLQPFLKLNEKYDNSMARKKIAIMEGGLSVNVGNVVNGGQNLFDADGGQKAGLLAQRIGIVGFGQSISTIPSFKDVAVATFGGYDVYSGMKDINDCSDANKFQEIKKELERQRDQIIDYQNIVKKMLNEKKEKTLTTQQKREYYLSLRGDIKPQGMANVTPKNEGGSMGQQPFRVLVRCDGQSKLTKKFFTENSTIRELKEEITKEYDFNPADVSLLSSGRVLEEEKTLGDYNIKSSACPVTLERKLRGGRVVTGSFDKFGEHGRYMEYLIGHGTNRGIKVQYAGTSYIYHVDKNPHGNSNYPKKAEKFYATAKDAIMKKITRRDDKFPSETSFDFYGTHYKLTLVKINNKDVNND